MRLLQPPRAKEAIRKAECLGFPVPSASRKARSTSATSPTRLCHSSNRAKVDLNCVHICEQSQSPADMDSAMIMCLVPAPSFCIC